jgi:hypothetical protein
MVRSVSASGGVPKKPKLPRVPIPRPTQSFKTKKKQNHRRRKHKKVDNYVDFG